MTDPILPRRNFYVYMLLRLDGRPFYVGRGTGTRIKMHEYKSKRGTSYKDNIICQIIATGVEVPKVIVADGLTHEEANAMEIKLIAELGRYPNGPLTNRTSGGEGIIDMPADSLARKRAKLKGRKLSPEARAKISRAASNPSPETRAKMRLAHRGRIISEGTKKKMSLAHKGKPFSETHLEHLRAAMKDRDPAIYQRSAETRRGSHLTEETKGKLRIAAKRQWSETRDALLVAMQKRPRPTPETRTLMSKSHKKRLAENPRPPRSAETKEKLRQANLGRTLSAEARAKVSAALRARPPQSAETRQKRRESVLRAIARKKTNDVDD